MAQIAQGECIRPRTSLSLEDARRLVEGYVEYYNSPLFLVSQPQR